MKPDLRPDRDFILMGCAALFAQLSTCSRAQVGTVISVNNRILVSGYNGAPAGQPHCDHECMCYSPGTLEMDKTHCLGHEMTPENRCPKSYPCTIAVHAEANALAFAARYGVSVEGATLHTTRMPCLGCAGLIINSGISTVVWGEKHRDTTGLTLLASGGIDVVEYFHE